MIRFHIHQMGVQANTGADWTIFTQHANLWECVQAFVTHRDNAMKTGDWTPKGILMLEVMADPCPSKEILTFMAECFVVPLIRPIKSKEPVA